MALEGIFAKINPFKINDLQTSVFLHKQVFSRLPLYDFFLQSNKASNNFSYPGMTFFCAYKKRVKKIYDRE